MEVSDFVVKVANPFIYVNDFKKPSLDGLRSAMMFAMKNKIYPLFYEGCLRHSIQLPKVADELMSVYERRRKAQLKALRMLIEIQEKYGIELMIFKTLKPFNYVPDDIDVLLRYERDLKILSQTLRDFGFRLVKVGTPEVVYRKIECGTYVDLDVHTRMAIGYLNIFKVEDLWASHAHEIHDLGDGYKIRKLSEKYEIVREAAYSLLKDFTLSIPGFYLAIHAMMKQDLADMVRVAKKENLYPHFRLYLSSSYYFLQRLYDHDLLASLFSAKHCLFEPTFVLRMCRFREIPYPYPPFVIAWAYFSKAWLEIMNNKDPTILLQIIRQPSSRGINILLKYLSNLLGEF